MKLLMCSLCIHNKSLQSCPTLCDHTDCSPPGSSVHGILQAIILEWVAIPFSRGSSQTWDGIRISCIGRQVLYHWCLGSYSYMGLNPHKSYALTVRHAKFRLLCLFHLAFYRTDYLWQFQFLPLYQHFPHSSVGKESACNAEDPSSIPGSGRSPGEGKGYPLQCSGLENSDWCTVPGTAKT